MFSRVAGVARVPLRRCLHTPSPKKTPFLLKRSTRTVLVAAALSTAFAGYQISLQSNDLALDALPVSKSPSEKLKTSRPSAPEHPAASSSSSGSDAFLPDQPPPSDTPAPVTDLETPDSAPPSSGEETVSPPPPSDDDADADEATSKPAASGAFNPETGEINWDCPCLGGMAHGPCGPEFKEAFSCFVFSEAEPKGINCVDKFQNMQNCFRAHPEVYADEIMDDDEDQAEAPAVGAGENADGSKAPSEPPTTNVDPATALSSTDAATVPAAEHVQPAVEGSKHSS